MAKNFTKRYSPSPWLIKRLLHGIATTHEDAVNAGYNHRLACYVCDLRHKKGWCNLIFTAEHKWYFIPKELRKEAWKQAVEQGYIKEEAA